jgi:hypothetical protein
MHIAALSFPNSIAKSLPPKPQKTRAGLTNNSTRCGAMIILAVAHSDAMMQYFLMFLRSICFYLIMSHQLMHALQVPSAVCARSRRQPPQRPLLQVMSITLTFSHVAFHTCLQLHVQLCPERQMVRCSTRALVIHPAYTFLSLVA